MALFYGVTQITFEFRRGDIADRFLVDHPQDVAVFIDAIKLRPKRPCACEHDWSALFRGPSHEVRVSFCDHCFNVTTGESPKLYHMPSQFEHVLLQHTGMQTLFDPLYEAGGTKRRLREPAHDQSLQTDG